MNTAKIYIAIIMSLAINFGVFYTIQYNSTNWQLNQSILHIGSETATLIENINLTTQMAKTAKLRPNTVPQINNSKVAIKKLTPGEIAMANRVKYQENSKDNSKATVSTQSHPEIRQTAQLKTSPPPLAYPEEAIKQNAVGRVTLSAVVNNNGSVSNIKIMISSGYKILDEAAIKWFKQLSFYPTNDGHGSISSTISQTISFTLKDANNAS